MTDPTMGPPPPPEWQWECFYAALGDLFWHSHTDRAAAIECARDRLNSSTVGRVLVREVCEETHQIRNQTIITREYKA